MGGRVRARPHGRPIAIKGHVCAARVRVLDAGTPCQVVLHPVDVEEELARQGGHHVGGIGAFQGVDVELRVVQEGRQRAREELVHTCECAPVLERDLGQQRDGNCMGGELADGGREGADLRRLLAVHRDRGWLVAEGKAGGAGARGKKPESERSRESRLWICGVGAFVWGDRATCVGPSISCEWKTVLALLDSSGMRSPMVISVLSLDAQACLPWNSFRHDAQPEEFISEQISASDDDNSGHVGDAWSPRKESATRATPRD